MKRSFILVFFFLFFYCPFSVAKIKDFLPESVSVDENGNLITNGLSKDGWSFDKPKGTFSKDDSLHKITKSKDGFTYSKVMIYNLDTQKVNRLKVVLKSNQVVRHIMFNNSQQVTAAVMCDSALKHTSQRGNPLELPDYRTLQASCNVVTPDSCKIQTDLIKKYYGSGNGDLNKKITECSDTLKKIDYINNNFAKAIAISDKEIDHLNSEFLNTSSGVTKWGEFLGSKFTNNSHYSPMQSDSIHEALRSVNQFTLSYEMCNEYKGQFAPSSKKINSTDDIDESVRPDDLGRCPSNYYKMSEKTCTKILPPPPPPELRPHDDGAK